MAIGISTSCFYPQTTEESLEILGKIGVKTCEVFLNTPGENTPEFAKVLNGIKEKYGMKTVSLHPFSSFAETVMLFSEYERRFENSLEYYKNYFETAKLLGAEFIVIHGSKIPQKISNEEYIRRFGLLVKAGNEAGIKVCQENVNNHLSENPAFLRQMRNALGDDFNLVFDVKQAVRAGFEPLTFAEEFKNSIVHMHLSDHRNGHDCLPPSEGVFDFSKLFDIMKSADYKGDYVIELYRKNFESAEQLAKALSYLQNL